MPGGAPSPMQFSQLQFAQPTTTPAQQMQALGKNLAAAGKSPLFNPAAPAAVDPGTAIQGGAGPIVAGGPQGPAPLPGQQALPGSPYSPQAGPVAPPGTGGPPAGGLPAPGAPAAGTGVPAQGGAPSPFTDIARSMSPPQLLQWLQNINRTGQMGLPGAGGAGIPGMPGSAAMGGAGMLPSNPFG